MFLTPIVLSLTLFTTGATSLAPTYAAVARGQVPFDTQANVRSYPVRWLGHFGAAHMTRIQQDRLPKLFVDGVPSARPAGHYWSGDLMLPSLVRARCYFYESQAGDSHGWMLGEGFAAKMTMAPDGVLQLAQTSASESPGAGCATGSAGSAASAGLALRATKTTGQGVPLGSACGIQPLTLAIETDVQFSALFENTDLAATWLTLQVLVAQDVLQRDLGLDLQVPYLGLHPFADDWHTPDVGGTAAQLMQEFQARWPQAAPVHTQLSHFFSGLGNGTSLAGQDGICEALAAYAVHTMRLDTLGEPDGRVLGLAFLHGLGHNLGARHTHDFCPPLDSCNPHPSPGGCQEDTDCSSPGTLMSFCHLCPGGLDRVDLRFHPSNVQVMASLIDACIPRHAPILAVAPATREPGQEWVVQIATSLPLLKAPTLRYWGSAGQGQVPMLELSGGRYSGRVAPAACGAFTQAQVWLDTAGCGEVLWPDQALREPLQNTVSELTPQFSDDFRINRGWLSLQGGASTGFWTRAIPVNDPNWTLAPSEDAGGDGWCFVTGNYWGNSDVDDGQVELISPMIAVQAGPLQIEFEYFLGLVNENGEDRLSLQCSWSGTQGPWLPVWQADQDTGGRWESVTLSDDYLSRWPRSLPGNLHLRFLARDGSPPSVVEAAIDSVVVSTGQCP